MWGASVVDEVQDVAVAGKAVDEKEKTTKEKTVDTNKNQRPSNPQSGSDADLERESFGGPPNQIRVGLRKSRQ